MINPLMYHMTIKGSTVEVISAHGKTIFENVSSVIRYPSGINIHGQRELAPLPPNVLKNQRIPLTTKACIASFSPDCMVFFHAPPEVKNV